MTRIKRLIGVVAALTVISLSSISLALADNGNSNTAPRKGNEDAPILTKGLDAHLYLRPGMTVEDAKKVISEANQTTVNQLKSSEKPGVNTDHQGTVTPYSGSGSTSNSFDPSTVPPGEILLANNNGGSSAWCSFTSTGYCHAGIFDANKYYGNMTDPCIRTANTDVGMKYESGSYWQHFTSVAGMKVEGYDDWVSRDNATNKAETYAGPYSLMTQKASNDKWYCSKVAWRAFYDTTATHIDIDADGGPTVYPGDIFSSAKTYNDFVWL